VRSGEQHQMMLTERIQFEAAPRCDARRPAPAANTAMETRHIEQTTDCAVGLNAQWRADLQARYIDEPTVTDVRIGVFYTAVEISTGDIGVAFTPRDLSDTVCCPKTAAGAPPAGRLIGIGAWEMSRYALAPSTLKRVLVSSSSCSECPTKCCWAYIWSESSPAS
jgi:hypothetical protein